MEKRYHTLNNWLREQFGEKVFKISIDGGFTCPNRDGTVGTGGCIFCSERGAGEFAMSGNDLLEQFNRGRRMMERKWKNGKYIAYLQSFTNTYGDIHRLNETYSTLISAPGVVALAIATRPDCLGDEVLELLKSIQKKTHLWVELGLQTSNDNTAKNINRGYDTAIYQEAMAKLREAGIPVVTHVILGLPGETREDYENTVNLVIREKSWGIKLHMLHVLKDTKLADAYEKGLFKVFQEQEYVELIADLVERLPWDMVIHRLTGDGARDSLVAPLWSLKKFEVLNHIDEEFVRRSSSQGCMYRDVE